MGIDSRSFVIGQKNTAPDWRRWSIVLPVVFVVMSGRWFVAFLAHPASLGYDARIYAAAARTMIDGGNPWTPTINGSFAGPPTTLIPYLPFAWLPPEWVAGLWITGNLLLAVYLLRRLSLPPWWLAFPPLFAVIIGGGVEILMVTILLLSPLPGLAAVLKPYAALPLLAERRWRQIALGMAVGILSLLVLPWGLFFASLPMIREALIYQSFGDSTFGNPLLMGIGIVALVALGKRGVWFAFPVLSPSTQSYYGLMCLPVLSPVIALCWALPIPQAVLVGVVAEAVRCYFGTGVPRWTVKPPASVTVTVPVAVTPSEVRVTV